MDCRKIQMSLIKFGIIYVKQNKQTEASDRSLYLSMLFYTYLSCLSPNKKNLLGTWNSI